MKLQELSRSPAALVLAAAVVLPFTVPLVFLFFPLIAIAGLFWLHSYNNTPIVVDAAPLPLRRAHPSDENEAPAAITAKAATQPKPTAGADSPPSTAALTPSPTSKAPDVKPAPTGAAKPAPAAAAAPAATAPAAGGAAILAKLRAQKAARAAAEAEAKAAAAKAPGLTVLYASQLGTAAEIAKNIHAEAESRGIKSRVADMNEFGFDGVNHEATPVVVMVSSSTGDGDAPDNAAKFYAAVRRRSNAPDRLKDVTFTSLGLGDSNYTRYMAVPRVLRSRFLEMGAETFYEPGEADEVDGLEEVVDTWLEGLWPALSAAVAKASGADGAAAVAAAPPVAAGDGVPPLPKCRVRLEWAEGEAAAAMRAAEAAGPSHAELAHRDPEGLYGPDAPFWAPISDAKLLTTPAAGDRTVIHLELDVAGAGMSYRPGDSVGVLPENGAALVDGIIERLGLDPSAVFSVAAVEGEGAPGAAPLTHLRWPCTVRTALARGCDLTTAPKKSLLRVLAEFCSGVKDKEALLHLCSRAGRDAYATEMLAGRPSSLDLLQRYASCKPPLDALLDALPPLPPRMYSLTCAPAAAPDKVQVAFTVVRYAAAGGEREGVATAWLERLAAPLLAGGSAAPRVPLFLRRGGGFRPPTDLTVPWIMIGPGTGVAPFRGFLQERKEALQKGGGADGAVGEAWLYFGCRRADQDFLYESDLKGFEADGTLNRLEVAFSRAQADKVYVQHLMAQHAQQLYDLIAVRKGYVFVCGDGAVMAKDVHATLAEILGRDGGDGVAALAAMAQEGRYVRDIWS